MDKYKDLKASLNTNKDPLSSKNARESAILSIFRFFKNFICYPEQSERIKFLHWRGKTAFTFSCKSFRSDLNSTFEPAAQSNSQSSQTKFRFAHSYGFTLAETLITVAILGIIAAVAIPSIIRKVQDKIAITQVKKAYALIDNALQQMYIVEGIPSTWDGWTNRGEDNSDFFASKIKDYLPVQKYCGDDYDCFQTCKRNKNGFCGGGNAISGPSTYKLLNNSDGDWGNWTDGGNVRGKMVLKNGMTLAVSLRETDVIKDYFKSDNIASFFATSYIRIDINGTKGPNRYGYDVFFFLVNDKGIQPKVTNASGCYSEESSQLTNGRSCAYWVMKHNNMDYKYRDVSSEW